MIPPRSGELRTAPAGDSRGELKAQNSQTGRFWTHWLYSGTQCPFCGSTQVPSLGSVDKTFGSVQRT